MGETNDQGMRQGHQNHQSEGRRNSIPSVSHQKSGMARRDPPQTPTSINQINPEKIWTLHNHKTSEPSDVSADPSNHLADTPHVPCIIIISLCGN